VPILPFSLHACLPSMYIHTYVWNFFFAEVPKLTVIWHKTALCLFMCVTKCQYNKILWPDLFGGKKIQRFEIFFCTYVDSRWMKKVNCFQPTDPLHNVTNYRKVVDVFRQNESLLDSLLPPCEERYLNHSLMEGLT
jgi:hypothetical protein